MEQVINKIKDVIERIVAFIPTALPRGIEEFNEWANSIIKQAGLPTNDSVKFALAVQVLHLDPTVASKPKEFFIRSLKKAASNQVVSQVINDLKEKQKAEEEAAKKKQAEATAVEAVVADVPK